MIIGVGVDIIEIERIAKAISRGSFLEKSFTDKEKTYFLENGKKVETLAGIFAAKESVAKAMGTGFRGFSLWDIEICHNDLGKPVVVLAARAKTVAMEKGISSFELSISHNSANAIAYVIAF